MEQTFYVNVLFGKNKQRIYDEILRVITTMSSRSSKSNGGVGLQFQINPFRTSPVGRIGAGVQAEIARHLAILQRIRDSSLESVTDPFDTLIFVNYTTSELEPALKYQRVRYYLSDYIDETNIEVIALTSPVYINFLRRYPSTLPNLNKSFTTYAVLTFHDTDADRRIADPTSLDLGEETEDDVTFVLQTRLNTTHINDDSDMAPANDNTPVILPYHPFRHSIFASFQNTKDNINAIMMSRQRHFIYYPFEQAEWLIILRNIMYERVFLRFLNSALCTVDEPLTIPSHYYRNTVAANYVYYRRCERKHKTQIINETVFDCKETFRNNSNIHPNWLNRETKINLSRPAFAVNIFGTIATDGTLI